MLNGILPRFLGLAFATVLPFTALFAGVVWDQWRDDDTQARRIRDNRFCSLVDGSVKGVTALSAPVFDGFGKMILALTAIGPNDTLAADLHSKPARELARCADAISAQLGVRPAESGVG